jgi:hypothetical protein
MAPYLTTSKHELIYGMIHSGDLSITEMAQAAGCNKSTILRISSSIRMFGRVKAPLIKGGQPRSITPVMLEIPPDWKACLILGQAGGFSVGQIRSLSNDIERQSRPQDQRLVKKENLGSRPVKAISIFGTSTSTITLCEPQVLVTTRSTLTNLDKGQASSERVGPH